MDTTDIPDLAPGELADTSVATLIDQALSRRLGESDRTNAVLNLKASCEIAGSFDIGHFKIVLDPTGDFVSKNTYMPRGFIHSKGLVMATDVVFGACADNVCVLSITAASDCSFNKCLILGNVKISDSKSARFINSVIHKKSQGETDRVLTLDIVQTPSTFISVLFSGLVGLRLKGNQHIIYHNNFDIDSQLYNVIDISSEAIVAFSYNYIGYKGKKLASASWKSKIIMTSNVIELDQSTVFMNISSATVLNVMENDFDHPFNISMDPDCAQLCMGNRIKDTDESDPVITMNDVSGRSTYVTHLF